MSERLTFSYACTMRLRSIVEVDGVGSCLIFRRCAYRCSAAALVRTGAVTDATRDVPAKPAPRLPSGPVCFITEFVDFAIWDIQSGLTTRAQLRESSQELRRLEAPAVKLSWNDMPSDKTTSPSPRRPGAYRKVQRRETGCECVIYTGAGLPLNPVAKSERSDLS